MNFQQFPPPSEREIVGFFSRKTLDKALDIIEEEGVQLWERSASHLVATVEGSLPTPYTVVVQASGAYSCSCPSEIQPCKHIAATLLWALDEHQDESPIDLQAQLQALGEAETKALLFELAQRPDVRLLLLRRPAQTAAAPDRAAVKALERALGAAKNIEHGSEWAERGFAALRLLPAEERSKRAGAIYDLLEDYQPDWSEYDAEDESGDGYWEDLRLDWMGWAMEAWASAEFELGHGDEVLPGFLERLESEPYLWDAALELADTLTKGGNMSAKDQLAAWLKKQRRSKQIGEIERFYREFLRDLCPPAEYEAHLRQHLKDTGDYLELFTLLRQQVREAEALVIAAQAIQRKVLIKGDHEGLRWGSESLMTMLEPLRQASPSFDWEVAAFMLKPTLAQYQALKPAPEFAAVRQKLLSLASATSTELELDLLLDDGDQAAIKARLYKTPRPEYAAKVGHLFPAESGKILRDSVTAALDRGQRTTYAEAARWAEAYRQIEDPAVFRDWLHGILSANAKRPALQDEWRNLKQYLQ
jgi:hypothetical protein